jgi:hypothetical protein
MRTKGVGPRNLGTSPLKAKSDPPVPGKAFTQGAKDYKADAPKRIQESSDAFDNRKKATGGIKPDTTIESLFIGGPAAKGIVKGLAVGGRKLTGLAAAGTRTAKATHLGTEAAHIGEVAHKATSPAHMKKIKR